MMVSFWHWSRQHASLMSWILTVGIALALLGVAIWHIDPFASPPSPLPISVPTEVVVEVTPQIPPISGVAKQAAVVRQVSLETNVSERSKYEIVQYKVGRGDSLFGVASAYKIKPETLYWANQDIFQGSPDNLHVGDVLSIPPVDGIYYKWEEGDTIESVAKRYGVDPETILNWPGNQLDLSNPNGIEPGTYVMIPGGEDKNQPIFIQTVSRYSGAMAQSCGGGYIGSGFFSWPAPNHYLSGYNYAQGGHRGIDIAATEGTPIYAADNGVVTMASVGAWNYGYGNVIQIDHGNGFVTVYAHLSQVYVSVCQSVMRGSAIGAAGNTGNSFGAHLHFEIRYNGVAVNPWNYLP